MLLRADNLNHRPSPAAYPAGLNTCGRITVDPSGQFVVVSNRGHNSIATLKVDSSSGLLKVGFGLLSRLPTRATCCVLLT